MKLALIDDYQETATITKKFLEGNLEVEVDLFSTGEELFKARDFARYSIFLVDRDLGWHNMNGYQIVRAIRAKRPEAIVIGYFGVAKAGEFEIREKFREAGADDFMNKQLGEEFLSAVLSQYI